MTERMYTLGEVADHPLVRPFGITTRTLRYGLRHGKWAAYQASRVWLMSEDQIRAMVASFERPATTTSAPVAAPARQRVSRTEAARARASRRFDRAA